MSAMDRIVMDRMIAVLLKPSSHVPADLRPRWTDLGSARRIGQAFYRSV